MTASATMNKQVQEDQERHDLLEKLGQLKGVEFDPEMSLDGLRELYATFGPNAAAENAKIEPAAAEEEPAPEDEPLPDDPDGKALFDRSAYEREDLAISKVDGQQIDKIAVKFAGRILLNRSDPADVALYNRLTMGKEVELRCAGKVTAVGAGWTTNRDGDLDAIVGEKAIKVETVWVLAPEELQA